MRATAMRLEGALRFADGRGGDTPSLLFEAAMALREMEPLLAREALMQATEAAMWAGAPTTGTTTLDVAGAASTIRAPRRRRERREPPPERLHEALPRGTPGCRGHVAPSDQGIRDGSRPLAADVEPVPEFEASQV
jgi:hypothetical protein